MAARDQVLDLLGRVKRPPGYELPGGAPEDEIRGFEHRTGLSLPEAVKDWLGICNGGLVGPGGLYGIRTPKDWLDIERFLHDFPEWADRDWIPIAGDGTGNHYLVATARSQEPTGVVFFVDTMTDSERPAFVVGSDVWHFLVGLLSRELGESWWPVDQQATLVHDPAMQDLASLGLPWE